ncbi:MAG: ribulose-phosphate 3-epimerase [Acidobacteria bacterium]|nr:ribulose-phosphate 3-epimerase [Acidobacteriota bacterium]
MKLPAIAPSILSADFGRLAEEVRAVDGGGAGLIHVDVMDGHFVPNLTIGPPVVAAIRKATKLPLDAHLMIENADRWVERFVAAGADMVSVHAEACPHLHRTVSAIRAAGSRPGVVLNPATPLAALDDILADVDYVLLMSVNPGFGGQKFIPAVRRKIAALKATLRERGLDALIEVDGGVDAGNAADLVRDGADLLVAGSAVFASGAGAAAAVARLRQLAEGARS